MEAMPDEVFSPKVFSKETEKKKYSIPVVYRKIYTGQPAFQSHSPDKLKQENDENRESMYTVQGDSMIVERNQRSTRKENKSPVSNNEESNASSVNIKKQYVEL